MPLVWAPLVLWGIGSILGSRAANGASFAAVTGSLLWGFLLWQALEYSIHRFVFHQEPSSYWGVTVGAPRSFHLDVSPLCLIRTGGAYVV